MIKLCEACDSFQLALSHDQFPQNFAFFKELISTSQELKDKVSKIIDSIEQASQVKGNIDDSDPEEIVTAIQHSAQNLEKITLQLKELEDEFKDCIIGF